MEATIAARLTIPEKHAVRALAARRGVFVSHVVRDALLRELREHMPGALEDDTGDSAESREEGQG